MRNIGLGALCLALASVGVAGNSFAADTAAKAAANHYSFALLTNTLNNTYQSTVNDTLKHLAAEHGDSYLVLDPDYDVSKQVNQMSDVADKQVSLVFLIPVDSGGVHAGLVALQQAGIPVINIDTAVVAGDVDLVKSVVATDDYMAGKLDGEEMVKNNPGGESELHRSCEGFLGWPRQRAEQVPDRGAAGWRRRPGEVALDCPGHHPSASGSDGILRN
jgi:ribose transport system substrate-binding protein